MIINHITTFYLRHWTNVKSLPRLLQKSNNDHMKFANG